MEKEEFLKLDIISNFSNYIMTKNYSINTYTSYISDLYYFYLFVKKDLTKVTERDIRSYQEELNSSHEKPTSIRRKISTFKSFYKFLYKNGYINKKDYPLNKVVYPKVEKRLPKFIYYNDLLEILDESKRTNDGIRDRLIIEMLYATGVRVSELVNIKLSDINFNEQSIRIMGKGRKERIVFYGEYAKDILDKYLDIRNNSNEYLIQNNKGNKITSRGIEKIIDKVVSIACINNNVSPHTFRHTFATHLLNSGCEIKSVQELLGHSSLNTTEVYTHITSEYLKSEYRKNMPRR